MKTFSPAIQEKKTRSYTKAIEKTGVLKRLQILFTLDLRSLALLRIGIGFLLLLDLFIRFGDLEAHYTNFGVLPLGALFRYAWNTYHFSFYTIASSFPLQAFLFVANMVCALCLLLGYRTRLFTFICWIFLLSLHNRNPLVQQAGDDLLRLVLFWGLFLPWGYYYSIDAQYRNENSNKPTQYSSLACLAYILQIFSIYFFSALLKSSGEWTTEFTALYYALSLDQILMPFGKLIYPFEDLLKALTALTYYTELILPFVLFIPVFTGWFRLSFFLIISMLHIGIALSLNVGLFPLICIVAMLGLLPDFIVRKIHRKFERMFTYFTAIIPNFSSRISRPYIPKEGLLKSIIVLFFIFYTLSWNIRTIGVPLNTAGINWIGHLLRIDQFWSMFAPSVFKDDGWFVLEASTENGEKFDLSTPAQPLNFNKPAYVAGTYKNDRWRKYSENILFIYNSHYRRYYCRYLMNKWNKSHDTKVYNLEIIYMKTKSLPGYQEAGPIKQKLCTCSL